MSNKPVLKIDWATHEASKHACVNWHYSGCMPAGKMVKVGIWEDGKFIGVILYSCGASPPLYVWAERNLGLQKTEICELTRIALMSHKTPVSRLMRISFQMLKKVCPGIRCIVSFADIDENHHGGIYQASNWTYIGASNVGGRQGYMIHGRKVHCRSVGALSGQNSIKGAKRLDPNAKEVRTKGKHKYLMPLDKQIGIKIAALAKPFPKRVKKQDSENPSELGGAVPTDTLQNMKAA